MPSTFAIPALLAPGDTIAVVAPSGRFRAEDLWRGLAWLRTRYRIRLAPGVLDRDGYFAGSDARRRGELEGAMRDPEVKAIVAVRGGYGATRVCDELPWDALARHPRWVVGFSDVTALHAMAWRAGVASVHGPNVTGLAAHVPAVRAAWLAAVERPWESRVWSGLRVLRAGEARGVVVGGNLALLHAMAAAGRLVVPEGAVLALEDVAEAPYRIDRMLTSLLVGGHLARASAIVLGGFERCDPGADGRTVGEVLEDRTRGLGVPVVAGAPFGHAPHNEAFVLGIPARVRGDTVTLGVEG
ncbi:MAG TPA: LD-carboxypeptidase [Polyangiaceae bacterium]|nr:LD-carboxypeptidase [Polyangiaceae bacterium]